jgi:hypothetical protein
MNNIENTLKSTRGRFFTLATKQGERFNAQLRKLTPKTAVVYDRNDNRIRRLMLGSIMKVGHCNLLAD